MKTHTPQERVKLACDLGFSAMKYIVERPDGATSKGTFPSIFKHTLHGVLYGNAATVQPAACSLYDVDVLVQYYPGFVRHLIELESLEGQKIDLAIGLPAQYHTDQSGECGMVSVLQASLRSEANRLQNVQTVRVLQQAVGGLFDYFGTVAGAKSQAALVIDIGFNTAIFVAFEKKRGVICCETKYATGVQDLVFTYLQPQITHLTSGCPNTLVSLAKNMRDGWFPNGCERINIEAQREVAARVYAENLMKSIVIPIISRTGHRTAIDTIVLIGGGAELLRHQTFSGQNVVVLDEPEFANARGFMRRLNI